MGLGVVSLEVVEILGVNRPLDAERAALSFPPGWRMFNVLLDTMEDSDGSNRVPVPRYEDLPAEAVEKDAGS
jgi:hypothetical protein